MLLLAGTIPCDVGRIVQARAGYDGSNLLFDFCKIPVSRGTAT